MIIDAHTHLGRFEEIRFEASLLVKAMRFAGVDHSLVFAFEHQKRRGITTEQLLGDIKKYPQLHAIGTASPSTLSKKRLDFLKGVLRDKKIHGIKFYIGYEYFYPIDKRIWPLYEALNESSLPAIFHTGYFFDNPKKGLLKYSHPLVVDELAVKFPNMKIIIAHMGNPWIMDSAAVAYRHSNVYLDISAYFGNPVDKKEIVEFYKDVCCLHKIIGSYEKLLFATDWPICDMKKYIEITRAIPFSSDEKNLFFWKNAVNLFQLDIESK